MLSSAATGALAGFVAGVIALVAGPGAGALDDRVAAGGVVVGAVLALVLDRFVAPLSVRKQVPQLWGRIFSARVTALLYGARLGVGPLTILRTWWWWLALFAGALAGVWQSVATGVVFGVMRIVVMLLAGTRAGALRRSERVAVALGVVTAAAIVGGAVWSLRGERGDAPVAVPVGERRCGDACISDRIGSSGEAESPAGAGAVSVDVALAARLPEQLGLPFARVADDGGGALGALDLDRAAAAEPDEDAERALLETRHFEAGHARAWRDPAADVVVYAAVYRFASPADASAYLVDGFITLEGRGARVYDVADPAGGRGFSQAQSNVGGGDVAHGVAFTRGEHFFLVFATSKTSAVTVDDAQRLARTVDEHQDLERVHISG